MFIATGHSNCTSNLFTFPLPLECFPDILRQNFIRFCCSKIYKDNCIVYFSQHCRGTMGCFTHDDMIFIRNVFQFGTDISTFTTSVDAIVVPEVDLYFFKFYNQQIIIYGFILTMSISYMLTFV